MVLQKRISLALVSVIMMFVAAQGYLAYRSLEEQEDNLVDEVLASETRRLVERIRAGDAVWRLADQPLRLGPNLAAWLVPSSASASGAAVMDANRKIAASRRVMIRLQSAAGDIHRPWSSRTSTSPGRR